MRGLAANPDTSPDAFCGVRHFFNFITKDENTPGKFDRLFSKCPNGRNLRTSIVKAIKAAAAILSLPPHLMHLHGVRAGIVEHLADFSDADQDLAGGWNRRRKEVAGRMPYLRPTLAWATRVTTALHSMAQSRISAWVSTAMAGPPRAPITRPHEC